jgi:hypothetical protein
VGTKAAQAEFKSLPSMHPMPTSLKLSYRNIGEYVQPTDLGMVQMIGEPQLPTV